MLIDYFRNRLEPYSWKLSGNQKISTAKFIPHYVYEPKIIPI